MFRQILVLLAFTLVYAGICCLAAGRMDWWRAWIYIAFTLCGGAVTLLIVGRKNPEILVERSKLHRGTKTFDKIFIAIYLPVLCALPVVAGLDAGRHGSSLPFAAVYLGALLTGLGMVPMIWAMSVNPYLENTVRIQTDRGHRAITAGPYRLVRHPMYVGIILAMFGAPLVLGSVWAFVPTIVLAALFVVRTALEDRTLRNELEGYRDYARHTRYRLLPGVW